MLPHKLYSTSAYFKNPNSKVKYISIRFINLQCMCIHRCVYTYTQTYVMSMPV